MFGLGPSLAETLLWELPFVTLLVGPSFFDPSWGAS
jgi:hypothetical protein